MTHADTGVGLHQGDRIEDVVHGDGWPSHEAAACPFPFYEALRSQAPVYRYPGRDEYVVSRWEDIVHVAQHPEIFGQVGVGGRAGPAGMAATDPPEHRLKRMLGLRMVSTARLREYEPMVRSIANELVDAFVDRGECDFSAEFAGLLPISVIFDIFGLPRNDLLAVKTRGDRQEGQGTPYLTAEEQELRARDARESYEYMRAAVLDRFEHPRDDYLSDLIQGQIERDGSFDLEYVVSEANTMLFAGNVTTAHTLASAIVMLCRHPDELAKVVADPSLRRTLFEETLRLESPVQWLARRTRIATELGGVELPAGAKVLVIWASGNRDGSKWEEADRFRVDRRGVARDHLAFGRGNHMCLGAPLARLEGDIAFDVLLSRLKNIRLIEERCDLSSLDSVIFRAPKRVVIAFEQA
jgi:cytochrome P450